MLYEGMMKLSVSQRVFGMTPVTNYSFQIDDPWCEQFICPSLQILETTTFCEDIFNARFQVRRDFYDHDTRGWDNHASGKAHNPKFVNISFRGRRPFTLRLTI